MSLLEVNQSCSAPGAVGATGPALSVHVSLLAVVGEGGGAQARSAFRGNQGEHARRVRQRMMEGASRSPRNRDAEGGEEGVDPDLERYVRARPGLQPQAGEAHAASPRPVRCAKRRRICVVFVRTRLARLSSLVTCAAFHLGPGNRRQPLRSALEEHVHEYDALRRRRAWRMEDDDEPLISIRRRREAHALPATVLDLDSGACASPPTSPPLSLPPLPSGLDGPAPAPGAWLH